MDFFEYSIRKLLKFLSKIKGRQNNRTRPGSGLPFVLDKKRKGTIMEEETKNLKYGQF